MLCSADMFSASGRAGSSSCPVSSPVCQYSPERSSAILLACCVLHNASLQSGLDAWTLERTDPLEQPESLEQRPEDRDSLAEDLRKQLILKHFSWAAGREQETGLNQHKAVKNDINVAFQARKSRHRIADAGFLYFACFYSTDYSKIT